MKFPERLLHLLLPLALLAGCGTEEKPPAGEETVAAAPEEDSAEATVRYIMDGVRNGQPVVAWNSLPPSYQTDINDIVRTFGASMDAEVWKQVMSLLGNVHQLLVDKQEFIVNHPAIAESENPEAAKESVGHVAGLLKTILDSTGNLEKLKQFDGGEFMKTSGSALVKQIDAMARLAPTGPAAGPVGLAALDAVQIETVTSTDTTATLKMTSPDGKEEEQEFVKVDGKWLPKDMAENWDQQVSDAKQGLAELPAQMGQMRMQVAMATGMVSGILTPLQSAETQEQFNQAVAGLQQSAMGFMGGPPGAGPGPGGFGPPGSQPPTVVPESLNTPPTESPAAPEEPAPEEPAAEEAATEASKSQE
ncbi:MAG: hypothetical protein RIK87_12220 [Fuerstiella sp.]